MTPDRQQLRISIAASIGFLRRHLAVSGRFDYLYDAGTGQTHPKYNLLRHAGTTWVLCGLIGTEFDDGSLEEAVQRAWAYLAGFFRESGNSPNASCCLVAGDVAKLGGTALSLLALSEKLRRAASRGPDDDRLLNGLARYLLSQQEEDGRFISKRDVSTARVLPFDSAYYPGEAILALASWVRSTGDGNALRRASLGARYLIDTRGLSFDNFEDHWLIMGIEALYRLDGDVSWLDPLRGWARRLVSPSGSLLYRGMTTQIATRLEALLSVAALELHSGDKKAARPLLQAILEGLCVCLRCQLGMTPSDPGDPMARGGFVQSIVPPPLVRIDYVQHVLAASFRTVELLDRHFASGEFLESASG